MINLGSSTTGPLYLGSTDIKAINLGDTNVYFGTIIASGGITGSFTSGSYIYKYHKFISGSGTFNVISGVTTDLQIAVVAGGGGGGQRDITSPVYNKGGGGGGVKYYFTTGSLPIGAYTASVGGGGSGSYNNASGIPTDGSPSGFVGSTIQLFASGGQAVPLLGGGNGSSGAPTIHTAGANLDANGVAGGGGGAGANGNDAYSPGYPGTGGNGLQYNLDGTNSYYGGGGGGGSSQYNNVTPQAAGGLGGGGLGGNRTYVGGAGTDNTGGGGGGAGYSSQTSPLTTKGGSGVVIITYKTAYA